MLGSVLQRSENAPLVGQRCTTLAPRSADRKHHVTATPRRIASPLHASLSFRYTQLIRRLEQDLAECRGDLELLESGQLQHRERRGDDLWVDTTQREIDWHKKRLACTRVSYANFAWNTENGQMAGELAFGPQQSRRRMLH